MGGRQGVGFSVLAVPGGHRAGKAGLRPLALIGLAALVALALQLGLAATADAATFNWYGEGNSTCIQNGQPPSSSSTNCGVVGEWYLNTSEPVKTLEGALVGDMGLTKSGDYCNAYYLNEGPFYTRDTNNESGLTGFNPSPPDTVTNGHGSVCQAQGTTWGQGLRPDAKATCGPCGMQHYVSFASQKDANGKASLRPWSNAFAGPVFVIEGAARPQVVKGSPGWGYLCPLFEWVNSPTGQFFEYCFVEWSQWGLPAPGGEVLESGNFNGHQGISLRTDFAPGTSFSTEIAGSGNSVYGTHTEPYPFKAAITEENLKAAIKKANLPPEKGGHNYGLSENPSEYALIGVEQGTEETSAAELGEKTEGLKLYTEFSHYQIAPGAVTNAPTEIQQTTAKLNGTVNPNGSDTHYYFEYGETTTYEHTTSSQDAGSGTNGGSVSAALNNLRPGTVYHYRITASNSAPGGAVHGADQTFLTRAYASGNPAVVRVSPSEVDAYRRGADGKIYSDRSSGAGWEGPFILPVNTGGAAGNLSVIQTAQNEFQLYWRGSDGKLYGDLSAGEGWKGPYLLPVNSGGAAGDPTLVRVNPTEVDAYWRGADGKIYADRSSGAGWEGPFILPVNSGGAAGNLSVIQTAQNEFQLYWRGSDGKLYGDLSAGEGWKGPYLLPVNTGGAAGDPTLVRVNPTEVDAYWRGSDGNIYADRSSGAGWEGPFILPVNSGGAAGNLSVIQTAQNEFQLYWRGSDGKLYGDLSAGEGWKGPYLLPVNTGGAAGDPSLIKVNPSEWDLYWLGSDGKLYGDLSAGEGWKGPFLLP